MLGIPFAIMPAGIVETTPADQSVAATVISLAVAKAEAVSERFPQALVLAADTLVDFEGNTLGKPSNADQARAVLRQLRGRRHSVWTGLCLRHNRAVTSFAAATDVIMRNYRDDELEQSIAAGSPFDKAGGYGIQDAEFHPVAWIDGCSCNVMGLPLWSVWRLLQTPSQQLQLRRPDTVKRACTTCPLRADDVPA